MTSSRARASQAKGLKVRKESPNELFGVVQELVDIKADLATITAAIVVIDGIVDDIKATLDAHV